MENCPKVSEYYKISKAAGYLGVSKDTLRKWLDSRVLPSVRNPINGYRLILEKDLKEFLWKLRKELKQ